MKTKELATEATPRPWKSFPSGPIMKGYTQPFGIAQNGKRNLIAGVFGDVKGGPETAEANAELICRAVNSFEAMREALKDCVKRLERFPSTDPNGETCGNMVPESAKNALLLAEGKAVQS